jgi:tetratricopeptide (TPR) repeat protein
VIEIACPAGGEAAMYCVLANNNLAYHLLLKNDPSAQQYAEIGLKKAQEYGLLELLPYLYSTLGEIALDQVEDVQKAVEYFQQGLELAETFNMEERIIGLTANLGRVEIKRGQVELAINHLTLALQKAELLGTRHQWAQIQLWLIPLLPRDERRKRLEVVKAFVEKAGRKGLLDQIQRLEH